MTKRLLAGMFVLAKAEHLFPVHRITGYGTEEFKWCVYSGGKWMSFLIVEKSVLGDYSFMTDKGRLFVHGEEDDRLVRVLRTK